MKRYSPPAALSMALAALLLLSGCGVRYATVPDREGRDLMLLGHDPVAYFIVGEPLRGDPALVAQHDGVWYYFARAEHREMFLREPAKYAPQYGAFCSSGATGEIDGFHATDTP